MKKHLTGLLAYLVLLAIMATAQTFDVTEKKVKTVYDINGRPTHSSQRNKGWHYVQGKVTLVSGKATVTLNTSTANGKQDISFLGDSTYFGTVWSLDTTNALNYQVKPLSGTQFMILSAWAADTATVEFLVEGQ